MTIVLIVLLIFIMFFVLRDIASENNNIWPPATKRTTLPSPSETTPHVLTNDVDEKEAKINIAILSKMIYDEVEEYAQ